MNDTPLQIARSGKTLGTYTLVAVRDALISGKILPTDHYWRSGMAEWKPVSDLTGEITRLDAELRQKAEAAAKAQLAAAQAAAAAAKPAPVPAPAPAPQVGSRPASLPAQPGAPVGTQSVDVPVALGAGLIFIGAFCPQVSLQILEGVSLNAFGNGTGELAVAAMFAGFTAFHALFGQRVHLDRAVWAGVAILLIPFIKIIYTLIDMGVSLSRLTGGRGSSGFTYNPFKGAHLGFIEIVPIPLNFQVGFGLVLLGTVILLRCKSTS